MATGTQHRLIAISFCLCAATLAACTTTGKNPVSPVGRPQPHQKKPNVKMKPFAYTDMTTTGSIATTNNSLYALPLADETTLKLIAYYAQAYNVPEQLVRRVVSRESKGNPAARNGPYWGLMQIAHPTAQTMGYKGSPEGLLDAETNLRYAVKYLAGAYLVAEGDEQQSVNFYARGYYYDAKRKGLLEETGLQPAQQSQ